MLTENENELKNLGIEYHVKYIEEHPDLVTAMNIRHSPNIIIDGKLALYMG